MMSTYLSYFKDLIEGKDVKAWRIFWKENKDDLEKILSRTEFLQLKFKKVLQAETMLKKHKIEFVWTSKGKQQKAWASLHESVCDENGKPLEKFRRKLFSGAFGHYLDNQYEDCNKKIKKHLQKIMRIKDMVERSEELGDAEYDAESFIDEGHKDFAMMVLKQISEINTYDPLLCVAIDFAKQRINEEKNKLSQL